VETTPADCGGKPARQRNQTLRQTRVAQIRISELGACPVVRVVLVDQSRMPLQTGWAKVNIGSTRLQAKTHTVTCRLVGNPSMSRKLSRLFMNWTGTRFLDTMN
jgi:hypothetical protein